MKKRTIILTTILMILTILLIISPITNATINPNDYEPGEIKLTEIKPVTDIASVVINNIAVIGIICSVITLAIIGIKYMTGSISEKAAYKKTMIPYVVGVFFVVGITQILKIIMEIVNKVQ